MAMDSGRATMATVSPAIASALRWQPVALAQHGDELGGEEFDEGRLGWSRSHNDSLTCPRRDCRCFFSLLRDVVSTPSDIADCAAPNRLCEKSWSLTCGRGIVAAGGQAQSLPTRLDADRSRQAHRRSAMLHMGKRDRPAAVSPHPSGE